MQSHRQEWIDDVAGYVKSLDGNHLVTLGAVGWYGASTPARRAPTPSLRAPAWRRCGPHR